MGAERRSMVMSEEEKRNTAYHEAGHAIVGLVVPYDPLHKVTIIPRGRALGVTMNLPEGDRYSRTRQWCEARLAVLFGGREAEIILGGPDNVTNGATGDIQMATQLARAMVMEWGMSDTLGRVRYNGNEQEVFLGHSVTQTKFISDETAKLIDEEIRRLIHDGEAKAKKHPDREARQAARSGQGAARLRDDFRRRGQVDHGRAARSSAATTTAPRARRARQSPNAGRTRPREEPGTGGMEPQPQS